LDQIRESLRLQKVYNTFMRYGMDMLLDRGIIGDFRRMMQTWIYSPPEPLEPLTTPVKTRLMIEELGPTYVKMGQIVSSQSAALPDEWEEELVKLQNDVPPFPSAQVQATIIEELGAPPEEVFSSFEPTALAAASTAQVHRATLPSGEEVVVKVQRPHIVPQVRSDLGIMQNAARVAVRRADWAQDINLVGVLDEFGGNILLELDYNNEAYNAFRLSRNMAGLPGVHIPIIYPDYSTSRVLTMEFIKGVKASNITAIDKAGIDKEALAENTLRAMVKQLLIDGFFHADPHPGNLLVNLDTGVVTFIDTGMVGELDVRQRISMINLMVVLGRQDTAGLAQVMLGLSKPFKKVDEKAYYKDFERRVGRLMEYQPAGGTSLSQQVDVVFDLLQQHGLRLDPQLTLALKAIMQAEALAQVISPGEGIINLANEIIQELVLDQITAENITKVATKQGTQILREVVQRMPSLQDATMKWLDQYQQGRFELHLDANDLTDSLEKAQGVARQATVGLMLVGMIIGSAIAATVVTLSGDTSSIWPNVALFGYVGSMIVAAIFVIILIWRLLRDKWREDEQKYYG
jgi:ubiquinone biosynthesis protein